MGNTDERFLPHLKDALPNRAHGYMSSGYSIALEGWRRGLNLKIKVNYSKKKTKIMEYHLSNRKRSHYFQITRGDLVSKEAVRICVNKDQTKEYLLKAGVETPVGKTFTDEHSNEEILADSSKLGYPLVLKPTDGTGGKGVIANIKNEEEMLQAISYVRGDLKFKRVIVEQYFKGEDHRFYVVDNEVIGVFKRDPASVTGNGKDSIKKLLQKKNKDRMKIPSLQNKPIKINRETIVLLERKGYTIETIPKKGEVVYLKSKNNVSSGGEAVDVTDKVSPEMKRIAVAATKAIPTLVQAGVDMIIDSQTNTGVVLEINSRAHIRTHLFPSYGKARDIPSAIIDYYFPETVGYDRSNRSKLYFDFDHVYESFFNGSTGYIEIPPIPNQLLLKRFILRTKEDTTNLKEWIKTTAVKMKISGYVKTIKGDETAIVVGGNEDNIKAFTNLFQKRIERMSDRVGLIKKERQTPIMQGFHIINDFQSEYNEIVKLNQKLSKDNKSLRKENKKLKNSISWKITKPLRLMKRIIVK